MYILLSHNVCSIKQLKKTQFMLTNTSPYNITAKTRKYLIENTGETHRKEKEMSAFTAVGVFNSVQS